MHTPTPYKTAICTHQSSIFRHHPYSHPVIQGQPHLQWYGHHREVQPQGTIYSFEMAHFTWPYFVNPLTSPHKKPPECSNYPKMVLLKDTTVLTLLFAQLKERCNMFLMSLRFEKTFKTKPKFIFKDMWIHTAFSQGYEKTQRCLVFSHVRVHSESHWSHWHPKRRRHNNPIHHCWVFCIFRSIFWGCHCLQCVPLGTMTFE